MQVVIISDIHDNEANLQKCLSYCEANFANEIICCGDITNDDTLAMLADNFTGRITLVRGNIALFSDKKAEQFGNVNNLGESGVFTLDSFVVGLCHEPSSIDKLLEKYAPDLVFFGHTHKPWIEERSRAKLVNPGTLGGVFSQPTFAAWDTEKKSIELILVQNI